MQTTLIHYQDQSCLFYNNVQLEELNAILVQHKCIILTDTIVANLYKNYWTAIPTILIPTGEDFKNQETINYILEQLIHFQADRKTYLIGIGGGVVCDIAGFVATIYMRGMYLGLVPTTLLAQVDAAIGGKNGINFGLYKNMLGTIRQANFLIQMPKILDTLSSEDYISGFAEVIKYALLFDASFLDYLENNVSLFINRDTTFLDYIIQQAVQFKNKIVQQDPYEQNIRKLLNLGHTLGHPIEKLYNLPHGYAVAIGMVLACSLSEKLTNFNPIHTTRIINIIEQYKLPSFIEFNITKVLELLKQDKKKSGNSIDFILLEDIGKPIIYGVDIQKLNSIINL